MIVGASIGAVQGLLGLVAARAGGAGVPDRVVEEALRATEAKFRRGAGRRAQWRVETYFWGVVRRRALDGGAPRLGDTMVLASLAEELRGAGHGSSEIHAELSRVYGGRVERSLIDVYLPAAGTVQAA